MKHSPINQFLDALASRSAKPGGGTVAAFSGAMGAALVSMVCNLTIGNKKHQDIEGDMKQVLARAEDLRHKLTHMIDDAAKTLDSVVAAYGMAKGTVRICLACPEALERTLKFAAWANAREAEGADSDGHSIPFADAAESVNPS
jgi:formiminotetrahydrofolate cyclodeaminase